MCHDCASTAKANCQLHLSQSASRALNQDHIDDLQTLNGYSPYVTYEIETGFLDLIRCQTKESTKDLLALMVHDFDDFRTIVAEFVQLGYCQLLWTENEKVEDECPVPKPGLERINYYLSSMSVGPDCKTFQYLYSRLNSRVELGYMAPSYNVIKLLTKLAQINC
ncbi:hypothetical protein ACX07_05585 [Vibrio parahaemolyticus]|nr:hypothetical protein [Vibrio parahaemolyticus]EGR3273810.1 hypothetical protein [Vibrio parahaemolyticus]EGR3304726.1 hypothetical protein [Vibrio parahaemolyticus]KOF50626.1 hypothetical protein ACX07_05585 [Vibrio parahaemolyticus]TOL15087.1 hypothetical protein CGI04_18185 [Vibrio parahaemolyticus]